MTHVSTAAPHFSIHITPLPIPPVWRYSPHMTFLVSNTMWRMKFFGTICPKQSTGRNPYGYFLFTDHLLGVIGSYVPFFLNRASSCYSTASLKSAHGSTKFRYNCPVIQKKLTQLHSGHHQTGGMPLHHCNYETQYPTHGGR